MLAVNVPGIKHLLNFLSNTLILFPSVSLLSIRSLGKEGRTISRSNHIERDFEISLMILSEMEDCPFLTYRTEYLPQRGVFQIYHG